MIIGILIIIVLIVIIKASNSKKKVNKVELEIKELVLKNWKKDSDKKE